MNLPKDNKKRGIKDDIELPTNYDSLSPARKRIVREKYIQLQGGRCYFCKGRLSEKPAQEVTDAYKLTMSRFPEGFLRNPMHLHHCHKTGNTIGVTHAYCNGILFEHFGE